MLNQVVIMGRLTRDPELRYTPSNLPVVSFSIAVTRNYSHEGGEAQTDFINIVAWRKTAEFISQWFAKGQMIIVVGSLQSSSWTDKNGNKRTAINVVASEVQFGEPKRNREENANATPYNQSQPANYGNTGYNGNRPQGGYVNHQSQPNNYGGNGAPQQQGFFQEPQQSQQPMNNQGGYGYNVASPAYNQNQPANNNPNYNQNQRPPQRQAHVNGFDLPNNPPEPSYDLPKGNSDFAEIADEDGEVPF